MHPILLWYAYSCSLGYRALIQLPDGNWNPIADCPTATDNLVRVARQQLESYWRLPNGKWDCIAGCPMATTIILRVAQRQWSCVYSIGAACSRIDRLTASWPWHRTAYCPMAMDILHSGTRPCMYCGMPDSSRCDVCNMPDGKSEWCMTYLMIMRGVCPMAAVSGMHSMVDSKAA